MAVHLCAHHSLARKHGKGHLATHLFAILDCFDPFLGQWGELPSFHATRGFRQLRRQSANRLRQKTNPISVSPRRAAGNARRVLELSVELSTHTDQKGVSSRKVHTGTVVNHTKQRRSFGPSRMKSTRPGHPNPKTTFNKIPLWPWP